jgi:hypothetical protein
LRCNKGASRLSRSRPKRFSICSLADSRLFGGHLNICLLRILIAARKQVARHSVAARLWICFHARSLQAASANSSGVIIMLPATHASPYALLCLEVLTRFRSKSFNMAAKYRRRQRTLTGIRCAVRRSLRKFLQAAKNVRANLRRATATCIRPSRFMSRGPSVDARRGGLETRCTNRSGCFENSSTYWLKSVAMKTGSVRLRAVRIDRIVCWCSLASPLLMNILSKPLLAIARCQQGN